MNYMQEYQSPLGKITFASDGECLTGLWFNGQKYFADSFDKNWQEKALPIFNQTKIWLDIYFSGREPNFTPPIKMLTTDFRKIVWQILLKIPYGQTITYGRIAKMVAEEKNLSKMSAQAVGGAVAHNSISIIIPCHRVIGSNGSLTGYAGGIDKKIKLLELEKVNIKNFFVPKNGTAL